MQSVLVASDSVLMAPLQETLSHKLFISRSRAIEKPAYSDRGAYRARFTSLEEQIAKFLLLSCESSVVNP